MAALALLIVGGMALVNAIMSEPDKKGPATGVSASSDGGRTTPSGSETTTSPAAALPVVIRVTGPPTKVVVRVADTGKVLANGLLNTGDTLQFKEAPLQVVASNGGAVQVVIYGKAQPRLANGQRGEWLVQAR